MSVVATIPEFCYLEKWISEDVVEDSCGQAVTVTAPRISPILANECCRTAHSTYSFRSMLRVVTIMIVVVVQSALAVDVSLPTSNDNLLLHRDEDFYQGTTRTDDSAWQGGMYGLVRNVRHRDGESFHTRFHEGIDIKPLYRDQRGEPLDSVRSISSGIVVYVNDRAGHSNYGKYVVVEHIWSGSPYYSLYAHLQEVWIDNGIVVDRGDLIGRLGYTGAGINKSRAHLHLEICMLYNANFQVWYQEEHAARDTNHHGIFNGKNLAGMDPARFLQYMMNNPSDDVSDFLASEGILYAVQFPRNASGRLDLVERYGWLLTAEPEESSLSWRVSFTGGGVPLRVEPIVEETDRAIVCFVAQVASPIIYASKRVLRRSGGYCILSPAGDRLVALLNRDEEEAGSLQSSRTKADESDDDDE